MRVKITYQIENGTVYSRSFIKASVNEALNFFKWRYGHIIVKHEVVE